MLELKRCTEVILLISTAELHKHSKCSEKNSIPHPSIGSIGPLPLNYSPLPWEHPLPLNYSFLDCSYDIFHVARWINSNVSNHSIQNSFLRQKPENTMRESLKYFTGFDAGPAKVAEGTLVCSFNPPALC